MSSQGEQLRRLVLDRGLEDWIPLPEAAGWAEAGGKGGYSQGYSPLLREVLLELLDAGRIVFYRGHWKNPEPDPVPDGEARRLLDDPLWYTYGSDDPDEERLSFVNVDNIKT